MCPEAAACGCRGRPGAGSSPGNYLATAPAAVAGLTLWYGPCIEVATVDVQSRGVPTVPTSLVVRALTVAAGTAIVLGGTSCGPYYRSPAPAAASAPAAAQARTQVQGGVLARSQTRRQLEGRVAQLERDPRRRAEASAIRARLRDGDFQVGDAIVLSVVGVAQFSDTFPVRAGRMLELPEVPPIPLTGVLRSELQPHLQRHIGRYVINPTVEAHSLVRVAVAGAVTRPGFYEVRPDAPLSEAVMHAGGFAREGDATRISVRRAGRTLIPEAELRRHVAMGATLDDLSIRPGDELRVGDRPRRNWLEIARTLAYVVVVATGLWATGRI
jgi:protein involved in polysaccharide export with SLBB domain